ncbi:hypothetical protein [Sphingomonas radiodurans]|uniref:hypothetical protein n=1 Tax=Sphingomonas radiodurans TaxID=2890321 RepID=UPI001E5EDD4B|nr:hypothetical protein [Sphingomonas radiodurans]WBH16655.1 hypothetical protein LLW23_00575 [Sphingomonas radiodurans]
MNPVFTGLAAAAPAIAMIAAFASALGGGWMIKSRRNAKKGWLMIVMAVVLVGNVLIWTI